MTNNETAKQLIRLAKELSNYKNATYMPTANLKVLMAHSHKFGEESRIFSKETENLIDELQSGIDENNQRRVKRLVDAVKNQKKLVENELELIKEVSENILLDAGLDKYKNRS